MKKAKLWTKEYIILLIINFMISVNFYQSLTIMSGYVVDQFHTSEGLAGLVTGIFIIGAMFSRILSGRFIVQIGYKKILVIGGVLCTMSSLGYLVANTIFILLIIRFFQGISFGLITTAGLTIVADIVPTERSGVGIGYYALSQTVGTAIGPFLGMMLSGSGSYTAIFIICVATATISTILVPFLRIREIILSDKQKQDIERFHIRNFFEVKVIPLATVGLFVYLSYSGVTGFLALFAREIDQITAASLFFVFHAALAMISRPLAGKIFDLKNENAIIYPALILFMLGMLILSQSTQGYMILISAGLIGAGTGALLSSSQAVIAKELPSHRRGLGFSTYFLLTDAGSGFGPMLIGTVIPLIGYRGVYFSGFIIAAVCILLYYILHGRKVVKVKKDI